MEARTGPRPEPRTHSTAPSRPRRDAARPAGSAHVGPGADTVLATDADRSKRKQDTQSLSWGHTSLWGATLHRGWLAQSWLVGSVSRASQKELPLCFKRTQSRKPQSRRSWNRG